MTVGSRLWHRLLSRGSWLLMITAALTLLTVFGIAALPSPAPLLVIDLETETLVQSIRRPDTSSIALTKARLTFGNGAELPAACRDLLADDGAFSGIVRPAQGALVRYRWRPDGITVTVAAQKQHPTLLIGPDEYQCELPDGGLNVNLPAPDVVDPAWRLPIAGPAAAGSEFGVPALPGPDGRRDMTFLRGGTVKVFGRSGWPFGEGELYPVEVDGFVIPAGSRLASSRDIGAEGEAAGASWYGAAEYTPAGFRVSATTETSQLLLFRPGASAQEETFAAGILARIFSDPNVALISIGFLVFSVIGQLVGAWVGLWAPAAGRPEREPEPRPAHPAAKPARRPARKSQGSRK